MNRQQRGFTIIELMIATTVVSVILLLVSIMMVNIGNLYYKGISQARVQDNARSITDELAQHLELSDGGKYSLPNGSIQAYCIDNVRYTFIIGVQIGSGASQSPHVLWRDTNPTPGSCPTPTSTFLNSPPPGNNGVELIGPRSRLAAFSITRPVLNGPYVIVVDVAYGENDLLVTPAGGTLRCKGAASDSFCAVANLTTDVVQRLP